MNLPENSLHATLLAQSVGEFVRRDTDLPRVRTLAQTGSGFDRAQWQRLAGLGWLGLLAPEAYGGLGLGMTEAVIVAEGLGRALTPEPYTAVAVFASRIIEASSNAALRSELLSGLIDGRCVPVTAWQEQADDFTGAWVSTTAVPCAGGLRVNGKKRFVMGADAADGYIVTAHSDEGLQLLWVPRDAPGCSTGLQLLADGRSYGLVRLRNVVVPPEHVLDHGSTARSALDLAFDHALVATSAELVGALKRSHEMSLDYLRTRVQFGKPIGSFQALQHRAADLHIQQELADAVLCEVAAQMDRDPDVVTRALLASRVKARCAEAALAITRAAIQFHGAMGYTEDCDVGLYVKRAMVLTAWLGNARAHRLRYADLYAAKGPA